MNTLQKLGITNATEISTINQMIESISLTLKSFDVKDVTIISQSLIQNNAEPLLNINADVNFSCNDVLSLSMNLDFEQVKNNNFIIDGKDKKSAQKIIENTQFYCNFGVDEIDNWNSDNTIEAEFSSEHKDIIDLIASQSSFVERWTNTNNSNPDEYVANLMYSSGGVVQSHIAGLANKPNESALGKTLIQTMRKKAIEALDL